MDHDQRVVIDTTPPSRYIDPALRRRLADELRSRFPDGPMDAWSAGWLSAAGYIGSDSTPGLDPGTDLADPTRDLVARSTIERMARAMHDDVTAGSGLPSWDMEQPLMRRHYLRMAQTAEDARGSL